MYLNKKKISVTLAYAKVQLIIGLIFIVFLGFGVVGGIADYANLRSSLVMYVFLILPFIWLVWLSIQKKIRVEKSRKLNQIFCIDADGEIEISKLVKTLNCKDELKAEKIVEKLIAKGFLTNCSIEQQPYVHVVLAGKASDGALVSVFCPNCGAKVEKRNGFSAPCPYCGTIIK